MSEPKQQKMSDPERDALSLPPMGFWMQVFALSVVLLLAIGGTAFVLLNPLDLEVLPHWGSRDGSTEDPDVAKGPTQLYQCPMHLDVIEPNPANCPVCGMALTPMQNLAEPGSGDGDSGQERQLTIDPVQVQNTGVVSVPAVTADIARGSRTVGILDFDAENITWINTKFEGWIEKVHMNYVGQTVRQGEPLFEIYSPELVTTQEEYLRALEYRDSLIHGGREQTIRQAESLVQASRERLGYWDIDAAQIRRLESDRTVQRRLTVLSPADGVVAEMMEEALEGMFVKPGMDLYKIADLRTLWAHADIYEADMPWIREGQRAQVSFRNDPTRTYEGAVLFLYPEVSPETRTLKVCIEVPNADGRLRPGMYADVVVNGPPVRDAVVIPQSAILRSGERNIVFVDRGAGKFAPREIDLGVQGAGDAIQVTRGIAPGEHVVTQAQFMLDSESRVQEAIARWNTGSTPSADESHAEEAHR